MTGADPEYVIATHPQRDVVTSHPDDDIVCGCTDEKVITRRTDDRTHRRGRIDDFDGTRIAIGPLRTRTVSRLIVSTQGPVGTSPAAGLPGAGRWVSVGTPL